MKDHEIAKLVNDLRDIAIEFHATQQLRERIAQVVRDALSKPESAEPVAWLRESELAELADCNYMTLGADSPKIWAPCDISSPTPDMGLVPVYRVPLEGKRVDLSMDEIDDIWEGLEYKAPIYLARAVIKAYEDKREQSIGIDTIIVSKALLEAALNEDAGEIVNTTGSRGAEMTKCTGCGTENYDGWHETVKHKPGCTFVAKQAAIDHLRTKINKGHQ
jgi:hypothetical protein